MQLNKKHRFIYNVIVLMIVTWSHVGAQKLPAGTWGLGGDLSMNGEKFAFEEGLFYNTQVKALAEYFPVDQLAFGIQAGYYYSYNRITSRYSELTLGPYVRYVTPFHLYIQGGYRYNSNNTNSIPLVLGYNFFVNPRFSIDPFLEYNKSLNKDKISDSLMFGIGWKFYFIK